MNSKKLIIVATSMVIVFIIALSLRLMPLKYGVFVLNEHDPFYQYYMANYVVNKGWSGFVEWFSWGVDHRFWAPWGRSISQTSFPGVAFIGAFLYMLVKPFGLEIDLMTFCCILPPILGAITAIAIFFLVREVEGDVAGILASLFIAVNSAYISRTIFGFFDDESVGILMLVIALFFYVRALKKNSTISGVVAGLALGYMGITWGAFVYPLNLLALYTLILIVMKRYSKNLLSASLPTLIVGLLVASMVPKNGIGLLTSPMAILPLLAIVTLIVCEVRMHIPLKIKNLFTTGYIAVLIVAGLAFIALRGPSVSLRYLTAVLPWIRSEDPLVKSVAEHALTTWSHFFLQFGFILLLGVAGLFFLSRRLNDVDVLLILLGVSTAYVAANLVRLNLLLAPVFSILAGIAASRLLSHVAKSMAGRHTKPSKKTFKPSSSYVVLGLLACIIILTPSVTSFYLVDPQSGIPIGVAYADSPVLMSRDWLSALTWIRDNLPTDAVVASWWDHGYWISIVGNRTTVCDNATINGTQIRLIAQAFLSNETEALKIFKSLGITHVVVHGIFFDIGSALGIPIPLWISWGHDYVAISYSAMASIAGFNVNDYIALDNFHFLSQMVPVPKGPKAAETTLYKLLYVPVGNRMFYLRDLNVTQSEDGGYRISYSLLHIPAPQYFKLVYASEPNQEVLVYEVLYDES
ncbi:MAG: STT3 domain-containing protein [Candidatus Nezhaarchaeales archaeon]